MIEKQFKILEEVYVSYTGGTAYLIGNGNVQFHVWENKEDTEQVCKCLNVLIDENEQLKQSEKDCQEWNHKLINENEELKQKIYKLCNFIEGKINETEEDLKRAVKAGMSTTICYSDLDLLEEIRGILND